MTVSSRFDLTGRVVIVTGGGKGIGKVYSQEFARAGAKVVAADIDGPAAEEVAKAIKAEGNEAIGLRTDVADAASTQAMADRTLEQFGRPCAVARHAAAGIVHEPQPGLRPRPSQRAILAIFDRLHLGILVGERPLQGGDGGLQAGLSRRPSRGRAD